MAVRNLVLSSSVNSQLAAGQAFKVERSSDTCFTYIPSSAAELKVLSISQKPQLTDKAVFSFSCMVGYFGLHVLCVCLANGHRAQADILITDG